MQCQTTIYYFALMPHFNRLNLWFSCHLNKSLLHSISLQIYLKFISCHFLKSSFIDQNTIKYTYCKSNCNTKNIYQIQLRNKNIKVNFLIFNVSYPNTLDILVLNWIDFWSQRTFGRSGDFLIVTSGRGMLLASSR